MSRTGVSQPIRTCIGCRHKSDKVQLIRVVNVDGRLIVDERAKLPGRGAYVHPRSECVENAVNRRAFPRALRTTQQLDPHDLVTHVSAITENPGAVE